MEHWQIKKGQPYPLGATVKSNGVNFSMVNSSTEECGIIIYHKSTGEQERIPFEEHRHRVGNIFCLFAKGMLTDEYDYNYYIGDKVLVDPYAKRIIGNEKWRGAEKAPVTLKGGFYKPQYEWQRNKPLHIPYSESIFYCLHVRSFTKHFSSNVENRGTFAGIVEKIPYLKELGITAIELLPAYEFEECEWIDNPVKEEYRLASEEGKIEDADDEKICRLNYWGFKSAYYFAPKASYAASDDPCLEFKNMVNELHKNGIELIMQFYFPNSVNQRYILEILKYWVLEYRIDGIHLNGETMPMELLATEPLFANTKLMFKDLPLNNIYVDNETPVYKNLGYYRDNFMYDMRKFLKGDYNMLGGFQYNMKNHNEKCGVVNYITNYYGFTLNDLVSYDRKHNEPNGENNEDGTDYNFSWNCGVEGKTRRKGILQLRMKQMRNAMSFLLMAQGTPLIWAGDEFCNSQNGNNNCYCQDNETSWLNWKLIDKNKDFYCYVKDMIKFRKAHPILHKDGEMSMIDVDGVGYPDLSYHSEEAWKVHLENYNRHIAMMYCGKNNDYIYIAYNMHWEVHSFALPSLPGGYVWETVLDTQNAGMEPLDTKDSNTDFKAVDHVDVSARSVKILVGKRNKKRRRTVTRVRTGKR